MIKTVKYQTMLTLLMILSLIFIDSCEELESVNPADPTYTLKAPTLVSVQVIPDVQMSITWQNNEEYSKEFVISRKSGSGSYSVIGTVDKNIHVLTDTACVLGTEYSYVVQSKVASNISANSNSLKEAITFQEPTNLTVNSISDESIRLTWTDNSPYEIGFKVERDAGAGFVEIGTVLADVTEYTDTGLTFGQSYDYRVAAYTSVITSSWTTITAAIEFPAPSDLTAICVSDSEIQLSWTDNSEYEIGFKVECDAGGGFVEIGTVSTDVQEFTDSGLTTYAIYSYRIRAFTASNNSDYSVVITTISCASCMVDIDGNIYETIQIGNQIWMAENLRVTHYRDGTQITHETDNTAWSELSTEAYCIYDNNASNEIDTYGAMYNWYAVNGDTDGDGVRDKEIAPVGWHVPIDTEWTELETYLSNNGHSGSEGTALKSTMGWHLSGNGTDFYGYTAMSGGIRYNGYGDYDGMGKYGYLWSATEYNNGSVWYRSLSYNDSGVYRGYGSKRNGIAIRCVRD